MKNKEMTKNSSELSPPSPPPFLEETEMNFISEGTQLEGKFIFEKMARIHGVLHGEVISKAGGILTLGETGFIEGSLEGDTLLINGCVQGHISAQKKVFISRTGRVIGDIITPRLEIEFGSYFEGNCSMPHYPLPMAIAADSSGNKE